MPPPPTQEWSPVNCREWWLLLYSRAWEIPGGITQLDMYPAIQDGQSPLQSERGGRGGFSQGAIPGGGSQVMTEGSASTKLRGQGSQGKGCAHVTSLVEDFIRSHPSPRPSPCLAPSNLLPPFRPYSPYLTRPYPPAPSLCILAWARQASVDPPGSFLCITLFSVLVS